jgi:hypothetical protein
MSLVYSFFRQNLAIVASDDLVSVEHEGKHVALAEKSPKFQVLDSRSAPIVLAAVGRADLSDKLFAGCPRMIADHGLNISRLVEAMPHILRPLYERRPVSKISAERDGIQAAVVGFDVKERRMRAFVFIADSFEPIEVSADPNNCFFALGWLEEPDAELQRFSAYLARHGERMGPRWVARALAARINQNSATWPGQVGQASYFVALDHRGIVPLADDLPRPTVDAMTATAANAIHAMAGINRFFLGSITTPAAGAPPTTGNDDGGTGSQMGWTNSALMTETTVPTLIGTGSAVSNAGNAIDGDLTSYATLTVVGNSTNGNSARLFLSGPPGLIQKGTTMTLQILASVLTNTLNGNVANACFFIDYATDGTAGGTVNIPATNVYPTNVAGQPHTLALAYYTASIAIGVNPGNVTLGLYAAANADSTSGTMTARVYDARLIATQ